MGGKLVRKVNIILGLLVMVFAAVLFPSGTAAETDDFNYEELHIQVMPQYVEPEGWEEDTPVVLIAQYGLVMNVSDEPFNPEFEIEVPADDQAFVLSVVGELHEDGSLSEEEYELNESDNLVSWTSSSELEPGDAYQYVIEYYVNPFETAEDGFYSFTYSYELERPADRFSLMVFEPYGSENFSISEEHDNESEMLTIPVYEFHRENPGAGHVETVEVSYEKEDLQTVMEALSGMDHPGGDLGEMGMGEMPADHPDISGMEAGATSGSPIIDTEGAAMISVALIIAGLLIFFGFRTRPKQAAAPAPVKDKKTLEKEKQELRKKFMQGEIDEDTYRLEMRRRSM